MLVKVIQQHGKQFGKYFIVGSSSTIIDIGGLYVLVEFAHLSVLVAATISFCVAVLNGFIFHSLWTFPSKGGNQKVLFAKFLTVNLAGLALNLMLLYLLHQVLGFWYILAKIITSGAIFIGSFFSHKFWTFR